MISSDTLILKLKLQSKLLAKSLNLPTNFGYDLLATAIYRHLDFEDLCDSVAEFDYAKSFGALSEFQKLKYLLICEVEDKEFIEDLHKEIGNMALRLEERTVINISKLDLISNIYKLFGLENESKYIIDAEQIKPDWQPCFQSLKDPQATLCSKVLINDRQILLLATKFQFDECSSDTLKKSLSQNFEQLDKSNIETNDIKSYNDWVQGSVDCLLNIDSECVDERPSFYTINHQNYLVFGFVLTPHKQISGGNCLDNISIPIHNTHEKQNFILNLEDGRLALELIYLNEIEDGEKTYLPKIQWIQDTVLSHPNAYRFPVVFNNAYYLMPIRPFSQIDWLENSL